MNSISGYSKNFKWIVVFTICFSVLILQINKPIGLDVDSIAYYELVVNGGAAYTGYVAEPVFRFFILFSNLISDSPYPVLLAIYFSFAIIIKLYAFNRDADFFLLSFFTYISFYLVLHEVVQIRVGLAIAIFLLALKDLSNKNLFSFLFKIFIASLCHYSALIALPLYFLNGYKINKNCWLFFIIISVCFGVFSEHYYDFFVRLISYIPGAIGAKLQRYVILMSEGVHSEIYFFNYYNCVLTFLSAIFIVFSDKIKGEFRIINIKIFILSQCSFFMLSFLPVLAYRVSEFLSVSLIYVFTYFLFIFKNKRVTYLLLLFILMAVFAFNLFIKSYINWSLIKNYAF